MTGDRSLRDYDLDSGDEAVVDDPLVFLAQPDSIIVSKEFAERTGTRSARALSLGTVRGEKPFTVRGIMKSSGLASAFGGNLAIMDIYAAQKMFGRGRTFDRIDLAVKPGATIDACQRQLEHDARARVPGQTRRRAAASSSSRCSAAYSMMVSISSLFALFIGMFIIYNSFAIAVTAAALGDRHPARARRDARTDPAAVSRRKRGARRWSARSAAWRSACSSRAASPPSIGTLISDVYGVAQQADGSGHEPGRCSASRVLASALSRA